MDAPSPTPHRLEPLWTAADVATYLRVSLSYKLRRAGALRCTAIGKRGIGGGLVLYYGLADTIHLSGALHYATTSNASFTPVRVTLTDGASSTGAVYADARSIAATGVAVFRYATPCATASSVPDATLMASSWRRT